MASTRALVELRNVAKDYGESVATTRVLFDINLTIASGEFTALIGPSGSGKSTLLNLIGLLDQPSEGVLLIDGVQTTNLSDAKLTALRGRTIGFVFQFHHLLLELTAKENVMMPLAIDRGRFVSTMDERAKALLRAVGLADKIDARASNLSGGQQQRVAIARALAMRPPLLLADEPTGNLDTVSSEEVFALLRRHNREEGTTCLIVTHDGQIAERCDRVIEIVDGRVSRHPSVSPKGDGNRI